MVAWRLPWQQHGAVAVVTFWTSTVCVIAHFFVPGCGGGGCHSNNMVGDCCGNIVVCSPFLFVDPAPSAPMRPCLADVNLVKTLQGELIISASKLKLMEIVGRGEVWDSMCVYICSIFFT